MPIDTTVWYHLVNAKSIRMLEVPAQSTLDARLRDGVFLLQGELYSADDSSPWSLWQFVKVANGIYDIFNKGSGRCLVIQDGGMNDGVPAWQYSVMPTRAQEQWRITDAGNGNSWIQNALSNRFLEIENGYTTKGAKCQQWGDAPPSYLHGQWQPQPTTISTVPKLTKGDLTGNKIHNNGKSTGNLYGDNLLIGCSVLIKKGNTTKTWSGVIGDNHYDGGLKLYWNFSVEKKTDGRDPTQEETVTVTVTNTQQQPSTPPLPAVPQPDVVP